MWSITRIGTAALLKHSTMLVRNLVNMQNNVNYEVKWDHNLSDKPHMVRLLVNLENGTKKETKNGSFPPFLVVPTNTT